MNDERNHMTVQHIDTITHTNTDRSNINRKILSRQVTKKRIVFSPLMKINEPLLIIGRNNILKKQCKNKLIVIQTTIIAFLKAMTKTNPRNVFHHMTLLLLIIMLIQ